jgi:hypothetical protein
MVIKDVAAADPWACTGVLYHGLTWRETASRRGVPGMAQPDGDRESAGTQDIIDDALRLVDELQRRLLAAGVRRGVAAATAAPSKGDVWEQAVREDSGHRSSCEMCPICRLMDALREQGVDVGGLMDRAGSSLRTAAEELRSAYERTQSENGERRSAGSD